MKNGVLAGLLLVTLVAATGGGYLYSTGYFEEQRVALRDLKRQGAVATSGQLFAAVAQDDSALIALLGRAGVSVRQVDEAANTPLHIATRDRRTRAVLTLLDQGVEINALNRANEHALQAVLEHADLDLAARLLRAGADPDFTYRSGQPALIEAIRKKQPETIRLLLEHGANPNISNSAKTNPLYLALRTRQTDLLPALIQAGASPDGLSPGGQPILAFLCEHFRSCGYEEEAAARLVEQFLAAGADPNAKDPSGKQALRHALEQDFTSAIATLLPRTDAVDGLLWTAINLGDMNTAKALIENGADVNLREEEGGDTPLTRMVREKRPPMVHFLMDHGADPLLLGKEGEAAVPLSIALGDQRTTLTLIGHDRAPPPDHFLQHPATPEFRKLFKGNLIDFYLRKTHNITPLMCAVCLDQEAVVLKLIETGARRFAATAPQKVVPVQLAARRKNVRMQQILIGVPFEDHEQERYFVINLAKQEVSYYKNGEKAKTAKISSGKKSHPTETGTYVITDKMRMHHSNLYDDAEMPYFQRFSCTAMGFHQGSLPGYAASHGCVRLAKATASYFFKESQRGDRVIIVEK